MRNSESEKKIKNKISVTFILMLIMSLIFNDAFSLVRTSVSSGNWNQTSTWDCGCVPASTDSAVIASGTSVTITTNTTIKGMGIQNNASLTLVNVSLSLQGGFRVDAGGILNGTNEVNTLLQIIYVYPNPGNRIRIDGTVTCYKFAINAGGNTALHLDGTGTLTIYNDLEAYSNNPKFYNNLAVTNVLHDITHIGSGSNFIYGQGGSSTLNIAGSILSDALEVFGGANLTINYNGNGNQTIKCPDPAYPYKNLKVSGSGTKTLGVYVFGPQNYFDIWYDLTIENCTLDASTSSRNIRLCGNWTNNGGTFIPRSNTVFWEWNNTQTISCTNGNETFYNVTINKSAGDVNLNNNVTVTNNLNLTSGDIVLGANNLTIEASGNITGSPGLSSHVQADATGVMKKMMNTSSVFAFPIGDNDEYSPFIVDLHNASFSGSDFISVRVTDDFHPEMSSVNRISRYWTLNCGGFTAINYDVSYNYPDADIEGDENNLYSLKMEDEWITYEKVNAAANTLFSNSGIIILPLENDFTGGSDGTLPVELIDFTATADDEGVNITWQTASESNNDFFTVEKSSDGSNFIITAIVVGKGNSNSLQNYSVKDYYPYEGISYYRLKQTDFDGQYSYSETVSVYFENKTYRSILIFPSPSTGDNIHLSFKYNSNDTVFLNVYDMNGTCVLQKTLYTKIGENNTAMNTSGFAKGKYIIQIMGFNRIITSDFIKY